MKKLKLSELELFKVRLAYGFLCGVMERVKQKPLQGAALTKMKTLEESVQNLEVFLIDT